MFVVYGLSVGLAEVSLLLMDCFWHVRAADGIGIGIVSECSPQATSNTSAGGCALSGF